MSTKQSTDDIPRLVKTLDRQSTGLSPTFHDRARQVLLAIGVEERDRDWLVATLSLKKHHQLNPVIRRLRGELGILNRHCHSAGMGHGRKPDTYSVNVDRLKAHARATPPTPVATLKLEDWKRLRLLENINFRKAKLTLHRWVRVARLIVAIDSARRVTYDKLAAELG